MTPSRITSFKVEQKPAIAEVKVSVVSVLLHQLKQLRVQNLLVRRQNLIRTDADAHQKNPPQLVCEEYVSLLG